MKGYRKISDEEIRKYAVVAGVLDSIPAKHRQLVGRAIRDTLNRIVVRVESHGKSGPHLLCQIAWEQIAISAIIDDVEVFAPQTPRRKRSPRSSGSEGES